MDDDNQNKKGYSSHEDFWENLQNFFDLHYRPPKVNETVVNELVKRYKQKHPEEFRPPNPPKKGFLHPDKNATA